MRRTDRLFDLIQILRDGRLHKAVDLARRLCGIRPHDLARHGHADGLWHAGRG